MTFRWKVSGGYLETRLDKHPQSFFIVSTNNNNELVVDLEETEDLDKPEEEPLGLFGKRKRTNNSNSVSKRKK